MLYNAITKALVVVIELCCLSDPGAIHLQGLPYAVNGWGCVWVSLLNVFSRVRSKQNSPTSAFYI